MTEQGVCRVEPDRLLVNRQCGRATCAFPVRHTGKTCGQRRATAPNGNGLRLARVLQLSSAQNAKGRRTIVTLASAVQERERSSPRAIPLPHEYEVSVGWGPDGSGVVTAGIRPEILGGPPPQFGGRAELWSPEHLLLSALSLCLMSTFHVFLSRQPFCVTHCSSRVKGVLVKTATSIAFSSIVIEVEFEAAAHRIEDVKRLLDTAKRHCIVANALKTPVELRISAKAA
jgi:organic hydroperoxide reductase OsmC/OhrA